MIKQKIESLLFVATRPLTAKEIFSLLKKDDAELKIEAVAESLTELFNEYQTGKGLTLVDGQGQYQFVTSAENSDLVKKFLRDDRTGELTQPSLEALTIIAYRGPISKPVIEQIRGVNCTLILRNLLIRGLVNVEERDADQIYTVTTDFLKYLGLTTVSELPDYDKLHSVENLEQFLQNRGTENITQEAPAA